MPNFNIISLLIGSALTLLVYISFAIITKLSNHIGSFKIFVKTVYSKIDESTCLQVINRPEYRIFQIPLWIEFINTKNTSIIVRNLNMILFNDNKEVAKTIQINYFKEKADSTTKDYFANKGNYSFVIPPYSYQKFDLYFTLKDTSINKNDFNKIKLSYYNSKGKLKILEFKNFEGGWNSEKIIKDDDWHELR